MIFLYIAIVAIFGGFIAIFIAFIHMQKTQKLLASIEPVTVRAEVLGDRYVLPEGYTRYDPYKLGNRRLSIYFLTDSDQYIKLDVTQKEFYRLIAGMYGDLTYHANKLVRFKHLPKHEEARRQQKLADQPYLVGDPSSNVYFYVDMPSLQIQIPTDQAIKANYDQVWAVVKQLYDNTSENFFGLDNEKQIIQFAHDGKSDEIVIDVPDTTKKGSYQAVFNDLETVQEVIKAFFQNQDVTKLYTMEFIKW